MGENKPRPLYYLAIGLVFVSISILLLYVLTRPAIYDSFDFSDTGQIGDTIGGITAPLFNIIGSILIFVSFREQFKANQIQQDSIRNEINKQNQDKEFNLIETLIQDVKRTYDNLSFPTWESRKPDPQIDKIHQEEIENRGNSALIKFNRYVGTGKGIFNRRLYELSFLIELNYCLIIFYYTLKRVGNYSYDKEESDYFKNKINSIYNSFFSQQLEDIITMKTGDSVRGTWDRILELFEEIEANNNKIKGWLAENTVKADG